MFLFFFWFFVFETIIMFQNSNCISIIEKFSNSNLKTTFLTFRDNNVRFNQFANQHFENQKTFNFWSNNILKNNFVFENTQKKFTKSTLKSKNNIRHCVLLKKIITLNDSKKHTSFFFLMKNHFHKKIHHWQKKW